MSIDKNEIKISHFVGLSGVGGVQRSFSEYIKQEIANGNGFNHTVYTIGYVDKQYQFSTKALNILKFKNLISLMYDLASKKQIVHSYNNLTSLKMAFFLSLIPTKKLIVHERGGAWNLPSKFGFILRFIAWKSDLILANSNATKILLEKKFGISKKKIKFIYNGVDISINRNNEPLKNKKNKNYFYVGFIGRLDTPKGVHVLIDAIGKLKNKNIRLIIAGDGPLKLRLLDRAQELRSVSFIGRISDTREFFNTIDLLVVPSIREPFGNVCIEAGLYKVPVLASYVDGIPEIIENNISGELIRPKNSAISSFTRGSKLLPLPEYVVNPDNCELFKPMEIDSSELAEKILFLSSNPEKLLKYANKAHSNIVNNFSIERYTNQLQTIYLDLMGT